jgi:hypothetical protein
MQQNYLDCWALKYPNYKLRRWANLIGVSIVKNIAGNAPPIFRHSLTKPFSAGALWRRRSRYARFQRGFLVDVNRIRHATVVLITIVEDMEVHRHVCLRRIASTEPFVANARRRTTWNACVQSGFYINGIRWSAVLV